MILSKRLLLHSLSVTPSGDITPGGNEQILPLLKNMSIVGNLKIDSMGLITDFDENNYMLLNGLTTSNDFNFINPEYIFTKFPIYYWVGGDLYFNPNAVPTCIYAEGGALYMDIDERLSPNTTWILQGGNPYPSQAGGNYMLRMVGHQNIIFIGMNLPIIEEITEDDYMIPGDPIIATNTPYIDIHTLQFYTENNVFADGTNYAGYIGS